MKNTEIIGNIINANQDKNIILVSILRNNIIPYSPRNKRANFNLPYSVLNPLTNSDSLSAKSKGARFVSIRQLISQIAIKKEAQVKINR